MNVRGDLRGFMATQLRVAPQLEAWPWWRQAWDWLRRPWIGSRLARLAAGASVHLKACGAVVVNVPLAFCTIDERRGEYVWRLDPPLLLAPRDEFSVGVTFSGPGPRATTVMTAHLDGAALYDTVGDTTQSTAEDA